MKRRTRCWTFALVVGCSAGVAHAEGLIPLPGRVAGGFVESGGRAALLVDGDDRRASALILMDNRGIRGTIDLPPKHVGRGLTVLDDGRILLESEDATTMHDRPQHYDLVEIRGNELETIWSWNSTDAFPGIKSGDLGVRPIFSGDGRAWGTGHGSRYLFHETGSHSLTTARKERFHVGHELTDVGKWTIFAPGFIYLDSAGPVIVAPWNKGAFIVHFSVNASPIVRPILFDNGVEEYSFRWQLERTDSVGGDVPLLEGVRASRSGRVRHGRRADLGAGQENGRASSGARRRPGHGGRQQVPSRARLARQGDAGRGAPRVGLVRGRPGGRPPTRPSGDKRRVPNWRLH